jgi:FixJ family two-component response regulator
MSENKPSKPPTNLKRGRLIAVVDDDYRVLESLEDLLQSSGYETLLSSCAEEFLESPRRRHVRVLISDIGLPGMSGIELVKVLQQRSEFVPTILITGRNEVHLEQDTRDLKVLRLLAKPFDTSELLDVLAAQFATKP